MTLTIKKIILKRLNMTLKNPFKTSFGTVQDKDFFIIEIHDNAGLIGYGESVAFSSPWYTEETTETTLHVMRDFLIPLLQTHSISHPKEVSEIFNAIRGNNMAKAALETAVWDLYAKQLKMPLYKLIGGTQLNISAGVSLGIEADTSQLINKIKHHVNQGVKRVKIKIKRDHDIDVIKKVRSIFPHLSLMVDANSAYSLKDIEHLKKFDDYNLLMIEQPLGHDDIAIKIHDYCLMHNIDLWCGGMLEAGVGRAHNIALSSLPGFNLPGDTGASRDYWYNDIITPEVTLVNGQIKQTNHFGIGYKINQKHLDHYLVDEIHFKNFK